jgi:hypothetical protein
MRTELRTKLAALRILREKPHQRIVQEMMDDRAIELAGDYEDRHIRENPRWVEVVTGVTIACYFNLSRRFSLNDLNSRPRRKYPETRQNGA